MSVKITPAALADIITKLLVDPASVGNLEELDTHQRFFTAAAELVCDFCGGEVTQEATMEGSDYFVKVTGNDSSPDDGGIWQPYDKNDELFQVDQPVDD